MAICTRPDVTLSVSKVAQHYKEPKLKDWKNVIKKIFFFFFDI